MDLNGSFRTNLTHYPHHSGPDQVSLVSNHDYRLVRHGAVRANRSEMLRKRYQFWDVPMFDDACAMISMHRQFLGL